MVVEGLEGLEKSVVVEGLEEIEGLETSEKSVKSVVVEELEKSEKSEKSVVAEAFVFRLLSFVKKKTPLCNSSVLL